MRTDGRVARPRPMGGLDRLCEHGSRATRQLGLYSADADRMEIAGTTIGDIGDCRCLWSCRGSPDLRCATTLVPGASGARLLRLVAMCAAPDEEQRDKRHQSLASLAFHPPARVDIITARGRCPGAKSSVASRWGRGVTSGGGSRPNHGLRFEKGLVAVGRSPTHGDFFEVLSSSRARRPAEPGHPAFSSEQSPAGVVHELDHS